MERVGRHENGTRADCMTAKDVEKQPRGRSPRYRRMKSMATELENAWWKTQRHLFSLPKRKFHKSIQKFTWAEKVCR